MAGSGASSSSSSSISSSSSSSSSGSSGSGRTARPTLLLAAETVLVLCPRGAAAGSLTIPAFRLPQSAERPILQHRAMAGPTAGLQLRGASDSVQVVPHAVFQCELDENGRWKRESIQEIGKLIGLQLRGKREAAASSARAVAVAGGGTSPPRKVTP